MKSKASLFLWRYGLASLSVGVATGLTILLHLFSGRTTFALFYAAVILSTLYAGLRPGLLAIALSALASAYFFLPPNFPLVAGLDGLIHIVLFVLVALLIGMLTSARQRASAALEAQRAFLGQVIDLNPNLIFAKDRQGRFTLVNQAVAKVYGTTVEELIGKTDADFTAHPAEVERFRADDLEVMDSLQEKFIPEETTTDATGQVRWLQTVKRPIIGEDGLAYQVLGVATDITAHKQAQAALTQLNETLEQRVLERIALIQLLQEIAAAANEAETLEEALQFTLDGVCAYIGWPVGHVYWLNQENPRELVSSSIWHLDEPERFETFRQVSTATHFRRGEGLPGQILASGELTWVIDITPGSNFLRAEAAIQNGLQAGFGFPLWIGEEIVAVLEFYTVAVVEPDGAFLEAATQIGTQLGRVVERKRAENQIRRLNAELEQRVTDRTAQLEAANRKLAEEINERKRTELGERLLAEASEMLIASTSYETALSNLARLIVPSLADWCVVDLIREDGLIHRLAVVHHDPAKAKVAAQLQCRYPALDPQGEHTITKMLRRGQSWFDAEVSETRLAAEARDAEHLQLLRDLGFASEMVVLLTARGRTLGALTLVRTSVERRYEAADLALAEELARRATIAVDNARLYEAEQRARQTAEQVAERMASLQGITAALSEALTPVQVAKIIVEQGVPAVGAAGGVVTHLNEDGTELEILHFAGYSPQLMEQWGRRFPVSTPAPLAEVTQTGEPVFIESLAELAGRYPAMTQRRVSENQAFAALPLNLEGKTIGGIGLSFAEPQIFNEDEREFMLTLAQQCAQALERARLYEVERQARAEAEATQSRLALLAEMRERHRLAQELHDTVAQALGYLNLKIGMTHTLLTNGQADAAKANLQELKNVVGEAYTDVREEIFHLRAEVQSGLGFMELLDRYIDKYRRFYNLDIQLVQEADPTLFEFPTEVTPQIIRTIQEALINIRKHAQVDTAIIRLGQENGSIRIGIEDQGQGFDLAKIKGKLSSFGLQIMHERVESVGGNLEVDTAPGQGTRVILRYTQPR